MRRIGITAAICVLSCCTTKVPNEVAKHLLTIDGQGRLFDLATSQELPGPISREPSPRGFFGEANSDVDLRIDTTGRPTSPRCEQDVYFDKVIDNMILQTQPFVTKDVPRRIMIYIHGGLDTWDASEEAAESIVSNVRLDQEDPYPIFVQWNSGGVDSLFYDWFWVRQGRARSGAWWFATPLVVVRDLAIGIVKAPVDLLYEFENEFQTAPGSSRTADARYCNFRTLPTGSDPDAATRIGHGEDKRTLCDRLVNGTSKVLTWPIRMLTLPVLAGVGPPAWEEMRRRTTMLFRTEDEMSSSNPSVFSSGPLSRFMRRLQTEFEQRKEAGEKWEITLAGHSMGAFAVNQILRDFPDMPIKHIVYLSAACSVRDYQGAVIPFLQKNVMADMHHVVLDSDAEEAERYDPFGLELAPRGSLLVWIDMYLSKPDTLLDRTAGRYVNLMLSDGVMDTILDADTSNGRSPLPLRRRVTVRQFNRGDNSPQTHGEVNSIKFWRPEEWKPREFAATPCEDKK